jgi:hypothetical protein
VDETPRVDKGVLDFNDERDARPESVAECELRDDSVRVVEDDGVLVPEADLTPETDGVLVAVDVRDGVLLVELEIVSVAKDGDAEFDIGEEGDDEGVGDSVKIAENVYVGVTDLVASGVTVMALVTLAEYDEEDVALED